MDLEVRHLKLIEAIATEGGMTRAAGRLHLTQSALSHQLKEIEDRLDTPLFLRLKKKMVLTEAGERVLLTARHVLEELSHAEQEVRKIGKGEQGVLRISTQCNTCYHWLPLLLRPFYSKYPGVEVRIVLEATDAPVKALMEGKLDLAVAYSKLPDRDLSYFPLFEDELVVVVPKAHPLASAPYVTAQNLAGENLILYAIPLETNLVFQKILAPNNITPRKIYPVMLTEAIIEMVSAEIGISVLARWAVAPYIKSGNLKAVRLTKKGVYREWSAVIKKNQPIPSYYMDFIELLAERAVPSRMKVLKA
ncbi:LysR family transcriptional regulator [bacterium]|nr:LysR family transcriptional regulator [bacterium]